jgi:hypothetical protein
MPSHTVESGLPFASVPLLAWYAHRFNPLSRHFPFRHSRSLYGLRNWAYVSFPRRVTLLNGRLPQLPAGTRFTSGGAKSAQQRHPVGHEMRNLHGSRFCAIVSSNLPQIENPR